VKILHFSDAHIGVDSIGGIDPKTGINNRVLDYLAMLDSIIDFANDEDVDLVVFTGDAFHVNNPKPIYLNEFSKRIVELRKKRPVVLLVGNHDMTRSSSASAIEIYNSLQMEGIIVGSEIGMKVVDTKAGKIQVTMMPYPARMSIDEISKQLNRVMKKIDTKLPSILLGHFSVKNAAVGSEASYSFGSNSEISLEDIARDEFDYVALGHIHKHQNLTTGLEDVPPVVYAGSIERVSFNEEKEEKGFVLVEIVNKKTKWEFILLDARPYKTLEIVCENSHATKRMLDKISKTDLKGAIVRYIIHISEEYARTIDEKYIQEAIMDAGAFAISGKRINVIKATQSAGRSEGFSVTMTKDQLLEKYLELMELSPKELKATLKMGKEIMEEVIMEKAV
jgi:DNA repair protein SbcD/Mre11